MGCHNAKIKPKFGKACKKSANLVSLLKGYDRLGYRPVEVSRYLLTILEEGHFFQSLKRLRVVKNDARP